MNAEEIVVKLSLLVIDWPQPRILYPNLLGEKP